MLCTHDWGMLAPPAKIGQNHSFTFAFSELLSFLLPRTRAGVMDPTLGRQGEGRRVPREVSLQDRPPSPSVSPGESLSQAHAL